VLAHLEKETRWAEHAMKPLSGLRKRLYDEMLGRIQETDRSAPVKRDEYWYYTRTIEGSGYPIHCRRLGATWADAEASERGEEVILDVNALAEKEPFMQVGLFAVSDDHSLLAYATDNVGFRAYTLRVKDLRTGALFDDTIPRVKSAVWAADNRTLLYAVDDDAKRPHRVYRHTLGSDPASDELVYEDNDERFRVMVWKARSREVLFVCSFAHQASEIHVLDARAPDGPLRTVCPRRDDHEYDVDHAGDWLYIRTNDQGRNFRLVRAPLSDPGEDNWQQLVGHRDSVALEDVSVFASFACMSEREDGLPHLRLCSRDELDRAEGPLPGSRLSMPEAVYSVHEGANAEYDTRVFRYVYESLTTPPSTYEHRLDTGEDVLIKRAPVLGEYEPGNYTTHRLFALASDGTRVPISLVYRNDKFERFGGAPMMLVGYGSYAFPYPVGFSSSLLSLLDRGVVYAIAHVRGGGEMGTPWHDDGRMLNKLNTFTDFIACADHLLDQGYAARDRLVIRGGSAGGLLMGAVANLRPNLCKAIISLVPFVDVINTMLDESLPLTVGEFEEWGNPKVKEHYEYMMQYSPYDNVSAQDYPNMLIRTSLHDSQVMYWEPAKYVARLRALRTDRNTQLLHVNMQGGHGGSSSRYDRLRETAMDYAYLLDQVGAK